MKPILSVIAGVALLAAAAPFVSQVSQAQQPEAAVKSAVPSAVGCRCVITLNPADAAKVRQGATNGDNYKVVGNTVEGELMGIDNSWIYLKDGTYENWVPRDKVLSMRVSR